MLFFALPNISSEKPFDADDKMHTVRQTVVEQLNDLTLMCTVAEYLNSFKGSSIDENDVKKYHSKIQAITVKQQQRFAKLDELINENILDIKKGKTTNKTILNAGKEVRKLEAGLRTLKIFVKDVLKMLEPKSEMINRVDERLYYFNKRSAALEAEMKMLQERLSFI